MKYLLFASSILPLVFIPAARAQTNIMEARPQQNIVPNQEIPTSTFDPAEDASPPKLRSKKMLQLLNAKKYQEFEAEYAAAPSADWATALAWAYYKDNRLKDAEQWFGKALALDPNQKDAAHGLAVLKERGKRTVAAVGPGSVQIGQANRSFQQKKYQKVLGHLKDAEKLAPLARGPRMLRAWSTFQLGRSAQAATLFEALYREKADKESAQGVLLSRQRLGQWGELREFATAMGGPIEEIYKVALAREFYDRGLFLAAGEAAPGKIPALNNIDSASVLLGGGIRVKSGQRGLSRLTAIYGPTVESNLIFDGVDKVSLEVQRFDLDSGRMRPGALFGTAPAVPGPFVTMPQTEIDNLVIPTLRYRHEGWTTPYAELGTTPLNGPVAPLPTGKLGVTQQMDGGYWQAGAFSKSVTESVLSYSGSVDPYTGNSFGRVIETGAQISTFHDVGDDWGVYGSGTAGWLLGKKVDDNQHVGGSLSLSKNLQLENFEYFSIGPVVSVDHYEENLSHFTTGHGGYFSPEYIVQGLGAVNFLTTEGRSFILRGNMGLGAQMNHQASSDFFPLNRDGRQYASDNNSSLVFNCRLEGVGRLSDHWQAGGEVGYEKSASYQNATGFFFLRYLVEPQPAVFSSDLSRFPP